LPARAVVLLIAAMVAGLCGCEQVLEDYPEVVVITKIDEPILVAGISFNGCKWDEILSYGEATSPGRCLPGDDRIHFKKFDPTAYCLEQAQDHTIDNLCLCSGEEQNAADAGPTDPGLTNREPTWFNYQTVSIKKVDYGDFYRFELVAGDMEQDFSTPGPYGH